MDLQSVVGRTMHSAWEILHRDGTPAEVQVTFSAGSCLAFTVWTDWSLCAELRAPGLPDYLWPPADFTWRKLPVALSEIVRAKELFDEAGVLSGAELESHGALIAVRSYGGELVVTWTSA
ncbi:hypothetical protein Amsp01_005660 [Amycolatopsis sp. NBRC 101858]|uniref:hypothetical protein n=1 Tax=Amycolatopsis sp. NBRC 101858 TaxID=3032200 RepID=UPI0024A4785E|nr:hypothetical protein [Amycolatopsis sp. NBRC 101858]GLY34542.1 hypothetical protein Amsp01_005660 [Amycolatopsis sp. NBRC 101858]